MKHLILITLIALPLYSQAPDPDALTAKVAIDSLAQRLIDQTARAVKAEKQATTLQGQLFTAQEQITQLLARVLPPDKVVSWISTGVPALYDFLLTMSAYPVTSFWSPGTWLTPQGERHTQVCIVNGPVAPVMVVAAGK